ncbi:UV-stimulated scaffold protein A isoform X4 [Syngnathus typhle]|uniref:UV-stimulated scaffold protein A isoform X4 n=1 Tax=Syngnathus typhle TaxID=161592 RepID=UPI002A69B287|nr:UV-stimulated scaffold protein A isoform X4 [Syngnathus typhle]
MELSQRDRVSELVEELTTSGQLQLNKEQMKKLKNICKESNDCINHVYRSLMSQLTQNHADIRLAALMIASDLFPKSHHFRTLLVENFQEFLELTVQTNLKRPLPPPQLVARKLRSLAVQTIQSWQSSYGSAYKKLELGYHFLKQFKKVDFQEAEAGTVPEQERQIERQRKMQRIYDEKLNAAIRELEDCSPDIEMTLRELDSCLKLLFPQFTLQDTLTTNSCHLTQTNTGCLSDDESPCCSKNLINDRTEKIQESKERVTKEENDRDNKDEREEKEIKKKKQKRWESEELKMRNKQKKGEIEVEQRHSIKHEAKGRCEAEERDLLHVDCFIQNSGLLSRSYRLDLNLSPGFHVEETEDNEVVVSTLFDLRRLLITKHLPAVRHWVQVFTKSGANQHLLRRALDLKISLESSLLKLSELNIDSKSGVNKMGHPCQKGPRRHMMAPRMEATVSRSLFICLILCVFCVLCCPSRITFTREALLNIGQSSSGISSPVLSDSDCLSEILVGAAVLYKLARRRRRGKRAGALEHGLQQIRRAVLCGNVAQRTNPPPRRGASQVQANASRSQRRALRKIKGRWSLFLH